MGKLCSAKGLPGRVVVDRPCGCSLFLSTQSSALHRTPLDDPEVQYTSGPHHSLSWANEVGQRSRIVSTFAMHDVTRCQGLRDKWR
jgi:hypothetical protein